MPHNDDLWQDNIKTLFDPCPAGWRVPRSGAGNLSPWNAFTADNGPWEGIQGTAGRKWSTATVYGGSAWYAAAGWRRPEIGTIISVGKDGAYWTATYTGAQAFLLFFMNIIADPWNIGSTYRARGYPVRCVRE